MDSFAALMLSGKEENQLLTSEAMYRAIWILML